MPLSKGHEANPTDLFQALMQQNVRKWQAPWRRAEKYCPTTIREAHIEFLKLSADYGLTHEHFVAGTEHQQQATIFKTDGRPILWQEEF